MLQIAKKKNKAAGFSFGSHFLIIGNKNIINEQDNQFAPVAIDNILGCATYGK